MYMQIPVPDSTGDVKLRVNIGKRLSLDNLKPRCTFVICHKASSAAHGPRLREQPSLELRFRFAYFMPSRAKKLLQPNV